MYSSLLKIVQKSFPKKIIAYAVIVAGILLSSFTVFDIPHVYAAPCIGGDCLCGANEACRIDQLPQLLRNVVPQAIMYAVIFIVFMAIIRLSVAVYALVFQNRAGAIKEAMEQAWQGFLGLLLFSVVVAGLLTALFVAAGINPAILKIFNLFFSEGLVQHAYAADAVYLPCPTVYCDVATGLNVLFTLAMRWVIYPLLIALWVWVGFLLVYARGAPEKLKEARKKIYALLLFTLALMMLGGLLLALQETFKKIQNASTSQKLEERTVAHGSQEEDALLRVASARV